ncbi:hypothetical protein [Spongiactinospora gelatinilytica]|uniref:restriction system modified-DNA reader domain-containing protein n=1 Tax=Spongiactinospora gelatinilytica TaxID=2666298 RepID=UPI0011B938AD|nr:hypothetical protein [Spongiactinospora gelatinilytica]
MIRYSPEDLDWIHDLGRHEMEGHIPTQTILTTLIPADLNAPLEISIGHSVVGMAIAERAHLSRLDVTWDVPGAYLLLDRPDSQGRWGAYVGKSSLPGLRTRVRQQLRTRGHWYRALLVRREGGASLHSGETGWLEGKLYDILHDSPQVDLHNGNRPRDLSISIDDQRNMLSYVPPVLCALRLIGHGVATGPTSRPATAERSRSRPGGRRMRSATTLADLVAAGLIQPGARLISSSPSYPAEAVLGADGWIRYGQQPHLKPTTAACAVTGTSVNGWDFWQVQTPNGLVKLKELRRQLDERLAAEGVDRNLLPPS